MILLNILIKLGGLALIVLGPIFGKVWTIAIGIPLFICSILNWYGLFALSPNEAATLCFYGKYKGTVKTAGLHWVCPFYAFEFVSLRSTNLDGTTLKVNDKNGNPIKIGVVIVYRIEYPTKALFEVNDCHSFVKIQAEAAVRHLANTYPYDDANPNTITLRNGGEEVIHTLKVELHDRFESAGIVIDDARISHLSYSDEIANAMLKTQQADSMIAARKKIVFGAVNIVEMSIKEIESKGIIKLNDEAKCEIVTNLLTVLTSDKGIIPTLNIGRN